MPVRRDPRTESWYFRSIVILPTGARQRISGTPGVVGAFHDLPNTKVGAQEAERRGIRDAMSDDPRLRGQKARTNAMTLMTLTEHAEGFVDLYKPESKPGEKREKRRILKTHLLPFFGGLTIEALRQEDIDGFSTAELARGCKVKSVNNCLTVLSTLIRYRMGERSKLRYSLKGMAGELAAVESDDVERLITSAPTVEHRVMTLLAAEAGLRSGEIRGLQLTDVKAGVLTVRRALDARTSEVIAPKHNKARTVPISARLTVALGELVPRGLWVLCSDEGSWLSYKAASKMMHEVYDAAGVLLPAKHTHALRHSMGTSMAKLAPLPVLQKLLGHASIATTMRYVDVSEDDKRSAIARAFGSHVAAAVASDLQTSEIAEKS